MVIKRDGQTGLSSSIIVEQWLCSDFAYNMKVGNGSQVEGEAKDHKNVDEITRKFGFTVFAAFSHEYFESLVRCDNLALQRYDRWRSSVTLLSDSLIVAYTTNAMGCIFGPFGRGEQGKRDSAPNPR